MSEMLPVIYAALGIGAALATLAGTLELLVLTLAGVLPARRPTASSARGATLRLAVVVPAHDEEAGISRTVASLRACTDADPLAEIVVVADNCGDATAERARQAGARVLERRDLERRGKGYALDFAFRTLMDEGLDAFLIVDADTVVSENLVASARRAFESGADAVQCRYGVLNSGASLRTRLMSVALMAFNTLRPRGRERLGVSVGILGNGFGLTADTLRAVPYEASSIVEDLEYHLDLVRAGRRVRFLDDALVRAEMPEGGAGTTTQRARWEGGRFLMIRRHAPRLALEVLRGRVRLAEPLFELLLLPLAYHVVLLVPALAVPFLPSRIYGGVALGLVGLHVVAAVFVGGGGRRELGALACAPFYVAWKLLMTARILRAARADTTWVRTSRGDEEARMNASTRTGAPDVSIVVVSFNTKNLLRECLETVERERGELELETFVVDNASKDGSAEMVRSEFPWVRVMDSGGNLGFAAANNVAFPECRGRHVVLLNSDAFLEPGALERAVRAMDDDATIGLAGARLVGRDGSWQPSARLFPSALNEALLLTGLAARYPRSRFFGRCDRTWADPHAAADVDWVPGAFSIVPRRVLEEVGYFDERFFLYYEEVDLCRRIRRAGYRVRYLPDVVVVHVGGESAKQVEGGKVAKEGTQLALWRMRSALMYHRKHHGRLGAFVARQLDQRWHAFRAWKNARKPDEPSRDKAADMAEVAALMARAWDDTRGGRIAPMRPW